MKPINTPILHKPRPAMVIGYGRRALMKGTVPPEIAPFVQKLLEVGGEFVLPDPKEPEDELQILGAIGHEFDRPVVIRRGRPRRCHNNVARLFLAGKIVAICTGWAMVHDDGVWWRHSWGLDSEGRIVETTIRRSAYWGLYLTGEEAANFAFRELDEDDEEFHQSGEAKSMPLTTAPTVAAAEPPPPTTAAALPSPAQDLEVETDAQ